MKKIILLIVGVFFILGCAKTVNLDEMDSKMKLSVENTMRSRGINVNVDVERLGQMDNESGFYFYKITVNDVDRGLSQEQYLFFNGQYLSTDFIDVDTNSSKSKDMLFDHVTYDVDVSKLSLVQGKPDAKNVIVKVTDFECSFCRRAYLYLEEKLKGRDDVALYIAHFPLKIHENAEICARIFEAGLLMGQNFMNELFTSEMVLDYTPDRLTAYFAEKSGDVDKFMELLYADEVSQKILNGLEVAEDLNVNSTPSFVINGKRIEGFDPNYIDRALGF